MLSTTENDEYNKLEEAKPQEKVIIEPSLLIKCVYHVLATACVISMLLTCYWAVVINDYVVCQPCNPQYKEDGTESNICRYVSDPHFIYIRGCEHHSPNLVPGYFIALGFGMCWLWALPLAYKNYKKYLNE